MIHRSRQEINQLISQHALLPLFNPDDLEVSKNVIKAAYDGGVRLFECTNRSAEAYSIFKQLVPFVQATMPEMVLGAGTIMDEAAAQRFYEKNGFVEIDKNLLPKEFPIMAVDVKFYKFIAAV